MTQFIEIENTQPNTLEGGKSQLLAGVNKRFFVISRLGQLTPLLEIPIDRLNYKVAGTSFYLDTEKREHHFIGNNVFTLSKYIEWYRILIPLEGTISQIKNWA